MSDDLDAPLATANAEIERLRVTRDIKEEALRIACGNIASLNEKCAQLTDALLKSMTLIDELMRENSRLCAASNEPPNVKLFTTKNLFDAAMKRLLS